MRYGRLTAIRALGSDKYGQALWLCRCDCGNEIIALGGNVRRGNTNSCGCLQRDNTSIANTKHGDAGYRVKNVPLYRRWANMIARCENPKRKDYINYGGRGISACLEWHDYPVFKAWALSHGYADNLQLDRKENDGNYEPYNCRFITCLKNQGHRRNSRFFTIDEETACATEWTRRIGRSQSCLWNWIRRYGFDEAKSRIGKML